MTQMSNPRIDYYRANSPVTFYWVGAALLAVLVLLILQVAMTGSI